MGANKLERMTDKVSNNSLSVRDLLNAKFNFIFADYQVSAAIQVGAWEATIPNFR
jgi:hypothetical protein